MNVPQTGSFFNASEAGTRGARGGRPDAERELASAGGPKSSAKILETYPSTDRNTLIARTTTIR
jgi:hypothetical protein